MITREVTVSGREVRSSGDNQLVRTSVGIDRMHVLFDNPEWLAFPVVATFANGETLIDVSLALTQIESVEWAAEATCLIPWEIMQDLGTVELTLHGTDSQTGEHIITEAGGTPFVVVQEGEVDPSELPGPNPTPPAIPIATTTTIGAVKPDGTTITVETDGTIHSVGGGGYVLPVATTSTLGGIKPDGTTITVDSDGTAHGASSYELPIAGASTLGGVKVGSGLAIDSSGVLSATGGASVTAITDSEIDAITGGTGYDDGDEVEY